MARIMNNHTIWKARGNLQEKASVLDCVHAYSIQYALKSAEVPKQDSQSRTQDGQSKLDCHERASEMRIGQF